MTAKELSEILGKHGYLTIENGDLRIAVEVVDARWSFGRKELQVFPVGGIGVKWVSADRFDVFTTPVKVTMVDA